MSVFGTDVCTICGGTVSANKLVSGPCWHHRDLSICQKAIRADERAKVIDEHKAWGPTVLTSDYTDVLADLRTQVKALTTRGIGARVVDDDLVTYALVERDEVLALLGAAITDGEISADGEVSI